MPQRIANICKIEKLGLVEEAIKLKEQGLGSVKISKALTKLSGVEVNAVNVDNFFKSMARRHNINSRMAQELDKAVGSAKLTIMGKWEKVDDQFNKLLAEANDIQTRIIQSKQGPVEVSYKDLRLWKDVLVDIARVTEIRAKLLGLFKPQTTIQHIHIEKQYNDLKQIIFSAETEFPGIGEFLKKKMLGEQD